MGAAHDTAAAYDIRAHMNFVDRRGTVLASCYAGAIAVTMTSPMRPVSRAMGAARDYMQEVNDARCGLRAYPFRARRPDWAQDRRARSKGLHEALESVRKRGKSCGWRDA